MPTNLLDTLPILSIVLSIAIAVGGVVAFRGSYGRVATETQEKVIGALQAQNEVQARQIGTLEKEIARLNGTMAAVRIALKRRRLRIEVEGETITLIDEAARSESITQIHITHKEQLDEGGE